MFINLTSLTVGCNWIDRNLLYKDIVVSEQVKWDLLTFNATSFEQLSFNMVKEAMNLA